MITEFSSDFSHMAQYLKIMNKRMVLLNPVSNFITHLKTNDYFLLFRNSSINNKTVVKKAKNRNQKYWMKISRFNRLIRLIRLINKKVREILKIEQRVGSNKTIKYTKINNQIYNNKINHLQKNNSQVLRDDHHLEWLHKKTQENS